VTSIPSLALVLLSPPVSTTLLRLPAVRPRTRTECVSRGRCSTRSDRRRRSPVSASPSRSVSIPRPEPVFLRREAKAAAAALTLILTLHISHSLGTILEPSRSREKRGGTASCLHPYGNSPTESKTSTSTVPIQQSTPQLLPRDEYSQWPPLLH
jgi:hypothetical protein